MIAVVQINAAGGEIARQLQAAYHADVISRGDVGERWKDYDAFVFISAMGICVRTIAPYIEDKQLSGHVGGANALTHEIADLLDAHEVITTQSDNAGLWALDTLAERYGWGLVGNPNDMNESVIAFVNREPTALLIEARDEGTDYMESTLPEHVTVINDISEAASGNYKLLIIVSPYERTGCPVRCATAPSM